MYFELEMVKMHKKPRDIIPLLDAMARKTGVYSSVSAAEFSRALNKTDNGPKAAWIRSETTKLLEDWKNEKN